MFPPPFALAHGLNWLWRWWRRRLCTIMIVVHCRQAQDHKVVLILSLLISGLFLIVGEWDDLCPISGHNVLQDSASITQLDKRFVALARDWRCCFASHCRLFRCENERRKRMHPSTSRQANKFCEGASRHPHIQVEYIPNLSYCLVKQCRVLHVLDMLSKHLKTSSFSTFHCSKTLLNTPQPSSLLSTRQKSHVLQDLGRVCEIYQVFSS